MAPGLPDRVDCHRLAAESAQLQRVFALRDLPRLQDLLADTAGSVVASFAFGGAGALVTVQAEPSLVCQRCLQGFLFPVRQSSAVEFASSESSAPTDPEHEIYVTRDGQVSLRELAEEELLLALPVIAACDSPLSCGRAPAMNIDVEAGSATEETTRPFADLQDLLKKT